MTTLLALIIALLIPTVAVAHPGSGIVVDRHGVVYFVDTGAGVWKIDRGGALTQVPAPRFHWMTLDADNRFASGRLPAGSRGEFARAGANPTLLLASDFPIVTGADGHLYYPLLDPERGIHIWQLMASGETSIVANLPAETTRGPLRWLNGLAAGPDGSLYYSENDAIRRISATGEITTVVADVTLTGCATIPGFEADAGPFFRGLAVDAGGTVYAAATGCGRVVKVTPTGTITTLIELQSPWAPTGVALFGSEVFVLEYVHTATEDRSAWVPRVRRISPDGTSEIMATVRRQGPVSVGGRAGSW